jgi:CRISPR-associated endoribonuclease Cas6
MQFQLTLRRTGLANRLPLNYQYPISAWIFKVIARADADYATFLHNQGYQARHKNFKLFTFSRLGLANPHVQGDRLVLTSPEARLRVSFYLDRAAEPFVAGLFAHQRCGLGDAQSQVDFEVVQVEALPLPALAPTLRLRALSPLVVGRRNERGHYDYLPPSDPDFGPLLRQNLVDKYVATGQPLDPAWADAPFDLRPGDREPKSQLITIKQGEPGQTKVRGFLFDFALTAPPPLLELGLLAGLGRHNAEGFGCVGVAGP